MFNNYSVCSQYATHLITNDNYAFIIIKLTLPADELLAYLFLLLSKQSLS